MRDFISKFKATLGFKPVVLTNVDTAQVSAIIDRQGFDSVTFLIQYGDLTDADATIAITMDHGEAANLSDAVAVTAAEDLLGTLAGAGAAAATDDNKVVKVGYRGSKRYVRLTATPTGNNAGAIGISCTALLAHPELGPQTTQKTV